MELPDSIVKVCNDLRACSWWRDVGTETDESDAMGTEFGSLVLAMDREKAIPAQQPLAWLVFFAARRALPFWDFCCDGEKPHQTVAALEQWLVEVTAPPSWEPYLTAATPAFRGRHIVDCRACDTSCAAESAAGAARFADKPKPFHAACALSAAYAAFDQSPLGSGEDFRSWLLDVAVPAAYQCRELTVEEQSAFRSYDAEQVGAEREARADRHSDNDEPAPTLGERLRSGPLAVFASLIDRLTGRQKPD